MAQAGRAQALPRKQVVGNQRPSHLVMVFEQQPGMLEGALLARCIHGHQHIVGGQDRGETVHGRGPEHRGRGVGAAGTGRWVYLSVRLWNPRAFWGGRRGPGAWKTPLQSLECGSLRQCSNNRLRIVKNTAARGPPWCSRPGLNSGRRHLQTLGGGVVMVLHLVLVAADLTVQLVHQLINGGVEVFMGLLDKDVAPLHMQRHFGALSALLLLLLLHGQQDVDVNDLVEVAGHTVQLGEHVFAQGRRDFKMMATDRQIHSASFQRIGS
mmetsp:Transcript_5514/g.13267  ORF Transcript_5514/g.13267 Transcript_5514/m.13267 type:complete len:267 (-) Transcript_5514:2115-2915(-)